MKLTSNVRTLAVIGVSVVLGAFLTMSASDWKYGPWIVMLLVTSTISFIVTWLVWGKPAEQEVSPSSHRQKEMLAYAAASPLIGVILSFSGCVAWLLLSAGHPADLGCLLLLARHENIDNDNDQEKPCVTTNVFGNRMRIRPLSDWSCGGRSRSWIRLPQQCTGMDKRIDQLGVRSIKEKVSETHGLKYLQELEGSFVLVDHGDGATSEAKDSNQRQISRQCQCILTICPVGMVPGWTNS